MHALDSPPIRYVFELKLSFHGLYVVYEDAITIHPNSYMQEEQQIIS